MRANLIWIYKYSLWWCNKDKNFNNIIIERQVNTLKKTKNNDNEKKSKDKLPFAVFICPKSNVGEIEDYKQIFTDIISDRIKQKYK